MNTLLPPQTLPPFLKFGKRLGRVTPFGRDLYRFLNSHSFLQLLSEAHLYGWFSGGCRILAEAYGEWAAAYKMPGELWVIGRVLPDLPQSHIVDHYLVRLAGVNDFVFMDADGPAWRWEYLQKYARYDNETSPSAELFMVAHVEAARHPEKYALHEDDIPRNPALSREIYARLLRRFDSPFAFLTQRLPIDGEFSLSGD